MAQQPDDLLALCTACGRPQKGPTHLCEHCGAPLTAFANTDWVLGIQSRGFAAYQATHAPRKLIIVIGMWMWMFPMLCMGLFMGFAAASGLLQSFSEGGWDLVLALLFLVLSTGLTLLGATILFRTTYSYCSQRPTLGRIASGGHSSNVAEAAESTECLHCGNTFAGSEENCPNCGWSFHDD